MGTPSRMRPLRSVCRSLVLSSMESVFDPDDPMVVEPTEEPVPSPILRDVSRDDMIGAVRETRLVMPRGNPAMVLFRTIDLLVANTPLECSRDAALEALTHGGSLTDEAFVAAIEHGVTACIEEQREITGSATRWSAVGPSAGDGSLRFADLHPLV